MRCLLRGVGSVVCVCSFRFSHAFIAVLGRLVDTTFSLAFLSIGTRVVERSVSLDSPFVLTSPVSGTCCVAKATNSLFGDASLRL